MLDLYTLEFKFSYNFLLHKYNINNINKLIKLNIIVNLYLMNSFRLV